jgi:hypothetical protein
VSTTSRVVLPDQWKEVSLDKVEFYVKVKKGAVWNKSPQQAALAIGTILVGTAPKPGPLKQMEPSLVRGKLVIEELKEHTLAKKEQSYSKHFGAYKVVVCDMEGHTRGEVEEKVAEHLGESLELYKYDSEDFDVMLHLSTKEIAKSNITKEVIAAEEGVQEVGMVDQQHMNGKNTYIVLIKLEAMESVDAFMEKGVINNHEVKMTKYEKTVKMHVEFMIYGMGVSKCGDDGLNDLMSMLGNDVEVIVDGKQHKGLGPLTSKWPPHMLNKGVMKFAC